MEQEHTEHRQKQQKSDREEAGDVHKKVLTDRSPAIFCLLYGILGEHSFCNCHFCFSPSPKTRRAAAAESSSQQHTQPDSSRAGIGAKYGRFRSFGAFYTNVFGQSVAEYGQIYPYSMMGTPMGIPIFNFVLVIQVRRHPPIKVKEFQSVTTKVRNYGTTELRNYGTTELRNYGTTELRS
jgi:hypothetical protein